MYYEEFFCLTTLTDIIHVIVLLVTVQHARVQARPRRETWGTNMALEGLFAGGGSFIGPILLVSTKE